MNSHSLMILAGITLGTLIADVPAVFAYNKLAAKVLMKLHAWWRRELCIAGCSGFAWVVTKLGFWPDPM